MDYVSKNDVKNWIETFVKNWIETFVEKSIEILPKSIIFETCYLTPSCYLAPLSNPLLSNPCYLTPIEDIENL